jgi:hypothetical protein
MSFFLLIFQKLMYCFAVLSFGVKLTLNRTFIMGKPCALFKILKQTFSSMSTIYLTTACIFLVGFSNSIFDFEKKRVIIASI